MKGIDPNQLTKQENYKLLSGVVIPRPIALVTSVNENGVVNAAPYSFYNVISAEPPLVAISVGRIDGEMKKHTALNAMKQKSFVVHIVDESILEKMNQTAAPYRDEISEIEKANLTQVPSDLVKVHGIKECKVRMECELYDAIPLGENGTYSNDLLIGKVLKYHIDEKIEIPPYKIDSTSLKPVARLSGPNYATLSNPIYLERPTDTE
ncbi:flavin reductase family protein [Halalkalibacillus halophilus]|uniref:flavin reductase family protein n=1 Tax=Halalkalibacillus halophilus TaxID=392827 RepID=UPI00041BD481|nr:flavin reductase family protein [Halalkalibacillus halophilus]